MTEADWLECTDVGPMLDHILPITTPRKLRLFACACCRQVWHHIHDERCRQAVETAERFADGLASREELQDARLHATVAQAAIPIAELNLKNASWAAVWAASPSAKIAAWAAAKNTDRDQHPDLIREIFGNPFRLLAPQEWPMPVLGRAAALYAGQRCAADLASELEQAGLTELAEHFHWPAHFKGCWAVDLLLEKT